MNASSNPNEVECPFCGMPNIVLPSCRGRWTCSVCEANVEAPQEAVAQEPGVGAEATDAPDEIAMAALHRELAEVRRRHQPFLYRGDPR